MNERPRQSIKARRKLKQGDDSAVGIASKYTMAIKQQREMMRPALSPSSANTYSSNDGMSNEDMDQILSPTFSDGAGAYSLLSVSNSADSIIRRVEQEIAAARKAASGACSNTSASSSPLHYNRKEAMNMVGTREAIDRMDQDDDLASILKTSSTLDDIAVRQDSEALRTSSSESSKNRAMNLIRNEFQEDFEEECCDNNNDVTNTLKNESLSELDIPSDEVYSRDICADGDWQEGATLMSPIEIAPSEEKKIDSPDTKDPSSLPEFNDITNNDTCVIDNRNFDITRSKEPDPSDQIGQNHLSASEPTPSGDMYIEIPARPHRTPTPSVRASRDDAPLRVQVSALSPREPEGNYLVTPRSPPSSCIRGAVSTPRQGGMSRTRELLENLKEQRESIASRSVASKPCQLSATGRLTPSKIECSADIHSNDEIQVQPETLSPNSKTNDSKLPTEDTKVGKVSNGIKHVTLSPMNSETVENNLSALPLRSAKEVADSITRQSSKIRFRNPFPALKPPKVRRNPEAIIMDHSLGLPEMPVRWVRPKKELRQLIVAAMGTSLPRRSNACGALKVLTKSKKNQMMLARTDGFLGALIFAANQSVAEADRDLAIDARTRAVCCLKNVCDPKDNRVIVFNHPGLVECLVKVIKSDNGEGRATATAAVALLAKTPGCREGLAQCEELIDSLARVLRNAEDFVQESIVNKPPTIPPKAQKGTDDSISAYSERSGDEKHEDNKCEEDDVSDASSLSSIREPPIEVAGIHKVDSIKNQISERNAELVMLARSHACAALLHLSRQCAVSVSIFVH